MEEFLTIYDVNKDKIEDFILNSIHNLGNIKDYQKSNYANLFSIFPSLELVYTVNKDTKIQNSPNYYKKRIDKSANNESRTYILDKLHFKDKNTAFSSPYISSATRSNCITLTIKEEDIIIFLDFKIETLLERLELIELNKPFHTLTKIFYGMAGFSLALLALFLIIYSLGSFLTSMVLHGDFTLDAIFKPIIALTLGIAIFDLAKTILEQEVYFKSYSRNSKVDTKMVTKFLITIIIALSIEGLMVVFKIAIENYTQMINALYLISGISFIIIALSIFIYLTSKKYK
ncbi:conserved hypothetical protein [Arcobacter nitrofigilis DSM 7299]|uniref:General glycosylation pathway protein n=1 Tax=Arcobacter nitrofigilis (strain ATCC 33309 / DSM 7299 / CCUG 15893 / LMG 7604 / NCTC 12251 / CI) TaxID=572480 RepID=D5V7B6_ARCNC|nr:hypothetical protein [Arcobacter nitrofigilis]ADG94536.1 conserved hypothetical protein [Arcobacter nitrofigilis DSM 7299]